MSASAVTFAAVLGVSVESLMVPYAAHLGLGAAGAGAMATVPAVAALLSALLIPAAGEDAALVRMVCLMVGGMSSVAIAVFLVDSPMPFVLIAFLASGALDVLTVPAGAVIGKRLPQASRGTAFSFLEGTLALSQAGGAVLAGTLATATSVPHASAVLAVPGLATACIGLAVIRRRRAATAEGAAPASREPLALEPAAPALAD